MALVICDMSISLDGYVTGPNDSRQNMARGNTNNHQNEGQNVLYADGHVDFAQSPFAGMHRTAGYNDNDGAGHVVMQIGTTSDDAIGRAVAFLDRYLK